MRSQPFSAPKLLTDLVEDQEGPVLRATLVSKFPAKFLNDSIIPKLEARGIQVEKVVHSKNASLMESASGDLILFMHEVSSHGEFKNAKDLAERSGIPMMCLSRKASLWNKLPPERSAKLSKIMVSEPDPEPKELGEVAETNVATNPGDQIEAILQHAAVVEEGKSTVHKKEANRGVRYMTDDELAKVLKFIMDRRNAGAMYKDIVEPLKKIWPDKGGPNNTDQMTKFVSSMSRSPRCPSWFRMWYNNARTRPGKAVPPLPTAKAASLKPEVDEKEPSSAKASDDAELAKMYAAENEMLRRTVSELKNSVDAAQNALKNSGTEKIRQDLEEIFASCEKLMSIGAINLQDTMRIAVTYLHARRV
jgi:hypothetical protein